MSHQLMIGRPGSLAYHLMEIYSVVESPLNFVGDADDIVDVAES